MFLKINSFYLILICCILLIFILFLLLLIIYINKLVIKTGKNKEEVYTILNKIARKKSIVFVGDSLTEFYRLDEFFSGLHIYNRGIAGNTTDDILRRLYNNVINISPQKVFLQIGTNDLGKRKKITFVYKNIIKIIETLKEKVPEAKIYLISLYPVNKKMGLYSKFAVGARNNKDIDKLNSLLQEYCIKSETTYIDVSHILKDNNGNLKKTYTLEGLHINSLGYLEITKAIKKFVL